MVVGGDGGGGIGGTGINLNLLKRERGGGELGSGNLVESEGMNDITLRKQILCLCPEWSLHHYNN